MKRIHPGVFRVHPMRVTPTKYISYFVRHEQGNLMFPCYARGGLTEEALTEIEKSGGLCAQFLCDMHMKDGLCDAIYDRFGALTHCSELEAPDVKRTVHHVRAFPFTRHLVFPHVEAIPAPGHRPGATCYLVDMGTARVMFAGDVIGHDGTRWTAYPNSQGRKNMIRSLESLAECEFDILCSTTLVSIETSSIAFKGASARRKFFQSIADAL